MLYDWMMRSRIDSLYGEMRSVENAMDDEAHDLDASAMMARIDHIERRAIHLRVPTAYDSSLYTMRLHIGIIRAHLQSVLENETPRSAENDRSSARRQRSNFSPVPPDRRSADR
jgi:hypothetical protein